MRISPSVRSKVCFFATTEESTNEFTGVTITKPVIKFKMHYRQVNRTLNQQYSLLGTSLEDTILIAIRETKQLDLSKKWIVIIDNKKYDIVHATTDGKASVIKYVFLTLKVSDDHG